MSKRKAKHRPSAIEIAHVKDAAEVAAGAYRKRVTTAWAARYFFRAFGIGVAVGAAVTAWVLLLVLN